MLLGMTTCQNNLIPSFQSFEFRFTQNCLGSANSFNEIKDTYEPGSLTYTQSQADYKNSMSFIQTADYDKENFNNTQGSFDRYQLRMFEEQQNIQVPQKSNNQKRERKRSILFINNIQLVIEQGSQSTQQPTKRSNTKIHCKGIQRKNPSRKNRILSSQGIHNQSNLVFQSISTAKNSPVTIKLETQTKQDVSTLLFIKQRSNSFMKTQDKSILSAVSRSSSKQRFRTSHFLRESCKKQLEIRNNRVNTERSMKNSDDRNSLKSNFVVPKANKMIKAQLLEDHIRFQSMLNVKTIKLEQNTQVSKNYLRRIIQNRVSTLHYVEDDTIYHHMRQ